MIHLSIDLETYSDVNLKKAGLPGRLVHLLPDGGNVLRNRHSESLPFPY